MERGPNILAYQKRLSEAGYTVKQDSIFGPETIGMTMRLQQEHGLPPTGKPDAATRDVLNAILQGRTVGPIGITGEGPKKKWSAQDVFNVAAALLAGLYLWEHFGGNKA